MGKPRTSWTTGTTRSTTRRTSRTSWTSRTIRTTWTTWTTWTSRCPRARWTTRSPRSTTTAMSTNLSTSLCPNVSTVLLPSKEEEVNSTFWDTAVTKSYMVVSLFVLYNGLDFYVQTHQKEKIYIFLDYIVNIYFHNYNCVNTK